MPGSPASRFTCEASRGTFGVDLALPVNMRSLLLVLALLLPAAPLPVAAETASDAIVIDIPVALATAKVVLNLDHPAFEGDEPTGLQFLKVMTARFADTGTKAELIAIFHGEAGYMLLDDGAYDRVRNWHGGNPYKAQIRALMDKGVAFEECGETMKVAGWTNADLIGGVRVNTGANFRIIELVQEGFVQIQP